MATAKKAEPKQTGLRVSYSIGCKANLGNYESMDFRFSLDESYDVSGMTPAAIAEFERERKNAMVELLDKRIEVAYNDAMGHEIKEGEKLL